MTQMMEGREVNEHFSIKPFTSILVCSSPEISKTLAEDQSAPLPRSGHRMVSVGHKLYLFGGYNPNISDEFCNPYWQLTKPLFAELWQYNTVSKQWRELYQCHMGRNHGLVSFGCVVSGHTMFHVGGTGVPFGECSNNWLFVCDLHTGAWEKLETRGKLPQPSYGQGVVLHNNDLYVVGGTTGFEYNMDVHHINIVDRKWTNLSSTSIVEGASPLPRYRHEVILHDNELVVFGGGQKTATASLSDPSCFSLSTRSWRQRHTEPDPVTQAYPRPRKCHVMVQHEHFVYVHGGCDEHGSFGDMWRLNLQCWRWQEVHTAATAPRHFHTAALTPEGCLYMHGGVRLTPDNPNGERTGDLLKCWLTVPPLRRLCWDALLHYYPHLLRLSPLALYHLGLPTLDIRDSELMPDPSSIPPAPVFSPPPLSDEEEEEEEDGEGWWDVEDDL